MTEICREGREMSVRGEGGGEFRLVQPVEGGKERE